MRWSEIDELLPDAPLSARDTQEVWVSDEAIDSVLVHLSRAVLGLPAQPFTTDEVDAILGAGTLTHHAKGLRALAAMCFGRWSVAKHLLAKPLAPRPLPNRDCSKSPDALARQLGTAIQTRAPSSAVAASMAGLRAGFRAGRAKYDPRLVLVAAHLYLHQIAPADDVPAACRAWLETGALPAHDPMSTDDVHVRIFERHQEELADEALLARLVMTLVQPLVDDWHKRTSSELAIKLFVAGWPLPEDWQRQVEPDTRRWLGGTSTTRDCTRWRKRLTGEAENTHLIRDFLKRERMIEALWLDLPKTVVALAGGGKLAAFKPGKTYGADVPAFVRYLAAAVAAKAKPEDVAPAWLAFLADRRPTRDPEHVPWRQLAMLQSVITERLGGGKPAEVGATLRATITGSLRSTT